MAQRVESVLKPIESRAAPRVRGLFNMFGLFERLRTPRAFDLYSEAMHLAGIAYRDQKDKGTSEALWHHIREVETEVEVMFRYSVTPGHLVYLKSLAILHEVFELRDANGRYLYSAEQLRDDGFPGEFVDDLKALAKVKGEPYLNYGYRVAKRPNAMMVKMADLNVNIRDRDHAHDPMSQSLQDKKRFLYPGLLNYFEQILRGSVDVLVTPVSYFKTTPRIRALFEDGELEQHWKADYQWQGIRPLAPRASRFRRGWNRFVQSMLVI